MALLENINKLGESTGDGKRWKDYKSKVPGGGSSAGFKYCSPGGFAGKWKPCLPLWSIAKCLPGICLFNPLSKAIWSWNVDGRPAAHRKGWMMKAGYMWMGHSHRPTQPHSRVETHAQILRSGSAAITLTTAEVNTDTYNYSILCSNSHEESHCRSSIRNSRDPKGKVVRSDFEPWHPLNVKVLSKPLWWLRVLSHSLVFMCFLLMYSIHV